MPHPTPPAPDTGVADRVVEELLADGSEATPGRFQLDREVARQKLRDFQLADPWTYPLQLLQAAVRRGATRVDVETDGRHFKMVFDGQPFERQDFLDLYDAMFSGGEGDGIRARQQLALAITAAQGLGAAEVTVRSGDGGSQGVLLLARREGEDEIETLEAPLAGTEITLEHAREGRGGLSAAEAEARLVEALRERGRYTGAALTVNGVPVPDGWAMPEAVAHEAFGAPEAGGPHRGVVGAVPAVDRAELRLVVAGVCVETRAFEKQPPGLVAVVTDRRFRADLTQGAVVQGSAIKEAGAAARQASAALQGRLRHHRVELSLYQRGQGHRLTVLPGTSTTAALGAPPRFYLAWRPRGAAAALEGVKRALRLAAWGLYLAPALVIPKLVLWLLGIPAGDYLIVAFVCWVVGFFLLLNAFVLLHSILGPRAKRREVLTWRADAQTLDTGLRLARVRTPSTPSPQELTALQRGAAAVRPHRLRGVIQGPTPPQGADPAVLRDTWLLAEDHALRLTASQRFTLALEEPPGASVVVDLADAPWVIAPSGAAELPAALHPEHHHALTRWLGEWHEGDGVHQLLRDGRSVALHPGDTIEVVVPRGGTIVPSAHRLSRRTQEPPPCLVQRRAPRSPAPRSAEDTP